MPEQASCGMIVLAAGASARMGRPKQLLPIKGKPLLRHVAEILIAAPVAPVVVVLGANARAIAPVLDGLNVCVVVNDAWAEGMGSSLCTGLQAALAIEPGLQWIAIALADQPDLTADHLERLLAARGEVGRSIVASESGGVAMPPVVFAAEHFPRLSELRGDAGARALLQSAGPELTLVAMEKTTDLDTPADYSRFVRQSGADSAGR